MPTSLAIIDPRSFRILAALLGWCTLGASLMSFSGWVFDIPRLTSWVLDEISIQPNTAVLIALASAAIILLPYQQGRLALVLGAIVALGGGLNLLQYMMGVDFGFNHQLLFGREWGQGATMAPGRFGPPASICFVLLGLSLLLLVRDEDHRRRVPGLAIVVVLLMVFSLLGYIFGARNFYAIPWLSAISLPSAIMLMALALGIILSVPEQHPVLLLSERSSAGAMARTVLPILVVMIPLLIWLRIKGHELGFFDIGTSRALGAAVLMLAVVSLMWIALMALRRREQIEREANQRKDEFLATLAHELRNPLAPISNAAAILKVAGSNPEVLVRATEMIERQTAHLVRLVDDLLDLSRISRGKMELRRRHVELTAIIHQALETCAPMAEAAGQKIIVDLPSQPIYLDADSARLVQVVTNLLSNACKFTSQPGQVMLIIEQQGDYAVIRVKDQGIGIPANLLSYIFEMFSQVDQSLERSQGGLGIGLTLAKQLVELHSGTIEAHSAGVGKGSEFVIRLPMSIDQTPPLDMPLPLPESVTPSRILIVDDNLDSAKSLSEVLQLAGNEIVVANDGEEAVQAAENWRPDAILLDLGMPKLNGFDACRRIRAQSWAKNTLIIALTGWGQADDRRKSAEAGFDVHMVKPINVAELLHLLAKMPQRSEQ